MAAGTVVGGGMGHIDHWAGLFGQLLIVLGGIIIAIGTIFKIPFDEDFWRRVEKLKNNPVRYMWSRGCWDITKYLEMIVWLLWFLIALCVLVFSVWPDNLARLAMGNLPHVAYTADQHHLLQVHAVALTGLIVACFLYSRIIAPFLSKNFSKGKWVGATHLAVSYILIIFVGVFCCFSIYVGWNFYLGLGVHYLPIAANHIVSHYNQVNILQLIGFGITSMAAYPIPLISAAAVPMIALVLLLAITSFWETVALRVFSLTATTSGRAFERAVSWLLDRFGQLTGFTMNVLPAALASGFWSLLMLVLGNHIQPEKLDVNLQLLLSNALFDGVSMAVTIAILRWAACQYQITTSLHRYDKQKKDYEQNPETKSQQAPPLPPSYYLGFTIYLLFKLAGRQAIFRKFPDVQFLTLNYSKLDHSKLGTWALEHEAQWRPYIETVAKQAHWRAIPACIANFILSAVFSCAALYFAVCNTPGQLTGYQVLWTFTGGFKDGKLTELGPLFWVTHSTFLPMLLTWLYILVLFIVAFILNPLGDWLVKHGSSTFKDPKAGLIKFGGAVTTCGGFIEACRQLILYLI